MPRNKYTAIRDDKPKSKDDANRPEFKACKFTTEAIITEGTDVGTITKSAPIPPAPPSEAATGRGASDAQFKVKQERRRRDEAIANVTGLRVFSAIGAAVPVPLMKRDLEAKRQSATFNAMRSEIEQAARLLQRDEPNRRGEA